MLVRRRIWFCLRCRKGMEDRGPIEQLISSKLTFQASKPLEDQPACPTCKNMCTVVPIDVLGYHGRRMFSFLPPEEQPPRIRYGRLAASVGTAHDPIRAFHRLVRFFRTHRWPKYFLFCVGINAGLGIERCVAILNHYGRLPRSHLMFRVLRERKWSDEELVTSLTSCRILIPEHLATCIQIHGSTTVQKWLRTGGMPHETTEQALRGMFSGWTRICGSTLRYPLRITFHAIQRFRERILQHTDAITDDVESLLRQRFAKSRHLALSDWTNHWTRYKREREYYFSDGEVVFHVRRREDYYLLITLHPTHEGLSHFDKATLLSAPLT